METALRVDPSVLREVAANQESVSAFVSQMAAGNTMSSAATAMTGLSSGAACVFVGTVLDTVAGTVGQQLSTHSTRLAAAADMYHRADEELGRRLKRLSE